MEPQQITDKKEKEIAESYLSSLIDLNVNSKPLINMLTMLAEENIEHGQTIVDAVEQRIAKVEPEFKLPILYLIDSIVKNVGREYIGLFSHSIVNIFCGVFEKVDEKIRTKMFSLRQTWNDVFPPTKLFALDIKVNRIDPGWPVTQPKVSSIHVNPNFFQGKSENDLQAKLQIKQRELLELKKRKLELELAATQKQLGQTPVSMDAKASVIAQMPDALTKPPHSMLPAMNPTLKNHINPVSHGVLPIVDHSVMNQVPIVSSNVRQRLAPADPALLSNVRSSRDPRLLRQTQNTSQLPHGNAAPHSAQQPTALPNLNGPAQRMVGAFPNNHRNRIPRYSQNEFNDKSVMGATGPIDLQSKDASKETKNRPSSASSYKKSSGKSSSSSSASSKSKSSSKGSSSKSSRGSSRSGSGRARSSSSSKDRKDDSKSPRKAGGSSKSSSTSPKESSKSPRKSSYDSTKSSPKTSNDKSSKRESRIRSKSPTKKHIPMVSTAKDVDLRSQLPLPSNIIGSPNNNAIINDTIIDTVATIASPINSTSVANSAAAADAINSTTKCEQKFNAAGAKDIDLRVGILPATVSMAASTAAALVVGSTTSSPIEPKKRLSVEHSADEPKSKKSKSEKIDILFGTDDGDQLFGTKDVDLRTLTPGIATLNPLTPPPPPIISSAGTTPSSSDANSTNVAGWAKMKGMSPIKSSTKSFDAVRAKLAKVTNRNNRFNPETFDENSQEANAKLKLIITQAQEQVDNENIDAAQFQSLVQQVDKIKSETELRRSHKRNNQQKSSKRMAVADKEAFSSDSGDEQLKQSHRVPSKRRRPSPPKSKNADSTIKSKSNDSTVTKERRVRKTKWSSPWEEPAIPVIPNAFGDGDVISSVANLAPPFMMPMVGMGMEMMPPYNGSLSNMMPIPAPIANPQQIVMAQHGSSKPAYGAKERTINIDGIPREIRFYDKNAIAFMKENGCEPKEIGFQSGERRLCVDGKDSIVLAFNDTYKTFIIDGKPYQVRFGSPTRELYIDNEWYECFFGDPPVGIVLDGKLRVFKIDGPAPQVRIGSLRTDLVVGKVDMYVDESKYSLFLDAQEQTFQVNNCPHTIQFADYFLTVIIDSKPYTFQYGHYKATKFQLSGADHYIRFAKLPNDIVPGKVFVRNMERTPLQRDLVSPPSIIVADVVPTPSSSSSSQQMLSHGGSIMPLMSIVPNTCLPSTAADSNAATAVPKINIDDLFQKLMATGILPQQKRNNNSSDPAAATSASIKEKERATPVLLSRPETLKKRQSTIVHSLFSGLQCSSCGVRFPPEQTMKYSQHLDWHFRQNCRERESARRAHSRKWYYDVSDWIQYEEIENLEEREKNWFETQQNEMDSTNDDSNQARTSSPIPSCVAGPDDHNKACDMCHDQFETFFNEETEEWHLRNAVQVDGSTYHPVCYQDYKASLTMDESKLEGISTDDNAVDILIKKEERESGGDATTSDQITLDEDDDVIVVPQEEPVITEIPDDDDDHPVSIETKEPEAATSLSKEIDASDKKSDDEQEIDTSLNNESDVQILEPQISVMDLDEIEDMPEDNVSSTTQPPVSVKIKEEPKYEGYEDEDDDFEDVGTFESEPIGVVMNDETSVDEYVSQSVQPQQTLITTMDGNVEVQDAAPTNIGTNKIKINITKNTVQLNNKNQINVSENIDNNLAINTNDGGGESEHSRTLQSPSTATNNSNNGTNSDECGPVDIEYELKDSMKHATFERQPVVHSGLETSGLCSIM